MNSKLNFSRIAFQGSPYDVGYTLGGLVEKSPQLKEINILDKEHETVKLNKKLEILREFCPNVIDEAKGLSDRLKIPVARLTAFCDDLFLTGACSQIAALPPITQNSHTLIGRSYEWTPDDEMNLMIIKEEGFPAQVGFSLFLFGRMDGMNELGLSVTMSSCEYGQPSYGEGIWFPLILRTILDNCSNTNDAVYLLKQMPVRCSANILIADKCGTATIAEIACYGNDRKISLRSDKKLLIATNHYINDDMLKYDNHHGIHSETRYKAIEHRMKKAAGNITDNTIKMLLSDKMPDGVCCPYYEDGLGTLRSMIFDVTNQTVNVCFGSPHENLFETISFNEPTGSLLFSVDYTNEYASDPNEFWKILPPGGVSR